MKIYTKTGDKGMTSLLGGKRVAKYHLRIESYGTVDELNSYVGLIRALTDDLEISSSLVNIQNQLFTIGSHLATQPGKTKVKVPELVSSEVEFLEEEIDKMEATLPAMRNFVLPGGTALVAHCHIARCVCRRAERLAIHLNDESEVPDTIIKYLNRLSDYLFVLSRSISHKTGAEEIPWQPNKR